VKYILSPQAVNEALSIPFTFQFLKRDSETKGFLRYIHAEIQKMMEFTTGGSSTRYIGIGGMSFRVFP
jgi:hypothetical protein